MNSNNVQCILRSLIALSFASFGVHQIIYGRFVSRAIGALPGWVPWVPGWAVLSGIALVIGAVAMGLGNRRSAVILAGVCIASAVLLHLPGALQKATTGSAWVYFGKGLALGGCAVAVAASRGARCGALSPERLAALAGWPIAAFMVLSGCLHFVYNDFVASLIPPWIPWHMMWTYFAAVCLIGGGIGIVVPATRRLATLLSGIMIVSWVPLVHIPSALHDLKNPGASVPVFEALAFGSALILVAAVNQRTEGRPRTRVPGSSQTIA